MHTVSDPSTGKSDKHSPFGELAIPTLLLIALGFVIWLTAFANVWDEAPKIKEPQGLVAQAADQISGIEAANTAIDLARHAVENSKDGDDGLLAGDLDAVFVRHEPLGTASSWTVIIQGPIRVRPNTDEEFRVSDGLIAIELSAFSGEVAGPFSAGRAFGPVNASGFLDDLGISFAGLIEVPLERVWPILD